MASYAPCRSHGVHKWLLVQPWHCLSFHLLLDPVETPWKPCETWWVNLKCVLRRRHSLAKQMILRHWDFPQGSLVILLIRDRLVLHFLRWVKSCREIDWWSIPGWKFWRRRSSIGRPGMSGISGLVHPSGMPNWSPGTSDWSPGMPDWSPGSSDSIGLHLFNDDTRPQRHFSHLSQVGFSQLFMLCKWITECSGVVKVAINTRAEFC